MNIFFYARTVKEQHVKDVVQLFISLQSECENLFVFEPLYTFLNTHLSTLDNIKVIKDNELDHQAIDYCIALGGDGSFLDAATQVAHLSIPLIGINFGRLGFLTDVSIQEINDIIHKLKNKAFTIEERILLNVVSESGEIACFENKKFAINEITLSKKDTSTLISLKMYINGQYAHTYWADGIIVSTPTGSTAYNLSCGGPIIFPDTRCLVVTPYASHNLNVRPLVLSNEVEIKFKVDCRTSEQFICALDSRRKELDLNTEIIIKKSAFPLRIVKINNYKFIDALTEKLNWGLDIRNN